MSQKFTILIVDDNIINRQYFSMSLNKHGYKTTTAEDGFEAIELAKIKLFDIILMDIRMPGIDGYKTSEQIRMLTGYKNTPILATSAENISGTNQSIFNAFLQKPISPVKLLQAIELHTDIPFNNALHFNQTSALKFAYNDEKIMRKLLDLFIIDLPLQFAILEKELDKKQYKICHDLIHKMRGSCKTCGADRLDLQLELLNNLIKEEQNHSVLLSTFIASQKAMSDYLFFTK